MRWGRAYLTASPEPEQEIDLNSFYDQFIRPEPRHCDRNSMGPGRGSRAGFE
jgi:hypothetical protein